MNPRGRRYAALLLLSSLGLAVAGQYYFARRREYLWDAVLLYLLAGILFVAAVRRAAPGPSPYAESAGKPLWQRVLDWLGAHPWRALLAGLSIGSVLRIGSQASTTLTSSQGYALLAAWAGSVLAFWIATADLGLLVAWLRTLPRRAWASRWELLGVLVLTVGAGAARLLALESIPYVLGGDEASLALQALDILWGRVTNPFVTGWLSHPTLYSYLEAFALRWCGLTITAARLMAALAGTLAIPVLYLLAKELFDSTVAFLAAAFLAGYHYAVHYSRLGYNNIFDPLIALLAFYLLFVGLRRGGAAFFALSGIFFGLAQYFYTGARVIPIILFGLLIVLALREPGFMRRYAGSLAVLLGAFLVTGWPLFVFFAHHPADFMARTTQLGILQSGWLARTAADTGRSQLSLLWEQVVRSVLAFHYYPDPAAHYHPGIPLLDAVSAVPFTLGLAYSLAHVRERRHTLLQLWLWGVLLFGSVLLENPPSSQRLVLSIVPASILVALGLNLLTDTARRILRWKPVSGRVVAGVAMAALAAVNLWFYFGVYTPSRTYAGYNTRVGQEIGLYLRTLGSGFHYYFLGAPRMYAGFPNTAYLAPYVTGEDVEEPLIEPPDPVPAGSRIVFIFLPERSGELEQVRQTYVQGEMRTVCDEGGKPLFIAYLPAEVAGETEQP